ncbi:MAG: TolC family protein [Flavobacteriales bacterium]|nr:TolC family protein [Flavobacteriales bacterium]MCX7649759.1 TolC family protein [Flavobacteriales bacterium]MDW8431207.1 TolC family protein [Flavobacteriales bacterium]
MTPVLKILIGGAFLPTLLWAQTRLTLEEALRRCRQGNLNLRIAQNEVHAAQQQVRQFLSTGLPQINATGNYYYNIQPQQFILPGEFFGQPGTFQRVNASPPFQASVGISANLRLIDGSYIYGLQASRLYKDITGAQALQTEAALVRDVKEVFGQILYMRENLQLLEEDIADAQKLRNETEAYVKQGFREWVDARLVQFSTDTLQLTRRRLTVALEGLELMLKNYLSLPPEEPLQYSETLESLCQSMMHGIPTSDSLGAMDLKAPELKILELSARARSLNEKVEFARSFPSLSTFLNWGYAGFSNELSRPLLFTSSGQYFPSGTVWGFSLNIPVFSSLYRLSSQKQARLQTKNSQLLLKATTQSLDTRLRLVKAQLRLALESLHQAERNVALQQEIQSLNRTKYREGLLSSFELLQTDGQFRAARRSQLAARYQIISLLAQYEYLTGKF